MQFLYIAKGSAAEVQAQLYVALDAGYVGQHEFDALYRLAGDTGRLLGGFIRYLKAHAEQSDARGPPQRKRR